MNYYIDTEFIEDFFSTTSYGSGFFKSWKPKKLHYVDLISIGIVSEGGREYYAVSKDFDLKYVWNKYDLQLQGMGDEPKKIYWLRENVLRPIYDDLLQKRSVYEKTYFSGLSEPFSYKSLKYLIKNYGKTNKQIAEDIRVFTGGVSHLTGSPIDKVLWAAIDRFTKDHPPTFYGYYADYDWVLFCSLFGRMLDLPKGYPMYCRDLKQLMDELNLTKQWKDNSVPEDNEHHALADARWNQRLHKMLKVYMEGLPQKIHQ